MVLSISISLGSCLFPLHCHDFCELDGGLISYICHLCHHHPNHLQVCHHNNSLEHTCLLVPNHLEALYPHSTHHPPHTDQESPSVHQVQDQTPIHPYLSLPGPNSNPYPSNHQPFSLLHLQEIYHY